MTETQKAWDYSDNRFYVDELAGQRCWCGKGKKRGRSFCWACWSRLPLNLRKDLFLPMGEGYEAAYDAALARLS